MTAETKQACSVDGNDDDDKEESSKAWRTTVIRQALPACQPQEGSPANTFTTAERERLQPYLNMPNSASVHGSQPGPAPAHHGQHPATRSEEWPLNGDRTGRTFLAQNQKMDILHPWMVPECPPHPSRVTCTSTVTEDANTNTSGVSDASSSLDWYGAPQWSSNTTTTLPRQFRQLVRQGHFQKPTNGVCPGFLQCNLVVLPQGKQAFDFLLFCQRNPKACPLIEVCEAGSYIPVGVAPDADLRTDCPRYAIYRNGVLDKEVFDATEYWPEHGVAFLIGCSFSYDGALMKAGIPLRSAQAGKNVPMYKTSLKCRSAGSMSGNIVVSMKPIPALQVAKHVEITAKYPYAHGGPICIGRPEVIGIADLNYPDWGEPIDLRLHPDDVPVFHACGVTPQAVLMASKVPFAITHSPGHMFVTDLPSNMNI